MYKRAIAILPIIGVIAAILLFLDSAPSFADVRATYQEENGRGNFVIEMGDDGSMRFTSPRLDYLLIVDGQAYSVDPGPGGPIVTTAEAIAYETQKDIEKRRIVHSPSDSTKVQNPVRYVPGRTVEIAGYSGTAYSVPDTTYAEVVLSKEESLLALGKALAAYSNTIETMSVEPQRPEDNLNELLESHGVLQFWGRQLTSVSFAEVDPARFAIPATPITLADVKAADAEPAGKDANDEAADIIKAVYLKGRLYTLTDNGELAVWAEGAAQNKMVKTPDQVHSFCALNGELFIVTAKKGASTGYLWSGESDSWTREAEIKSSTKNPFISLDCTGTEPFLVSGATIVMPRSGRAIPVKSNATEFGGFATTLQHGGYLYVGVNAGEWGGGLQRISLTSGKAERVDASDPKELCGGVLNKSCDPVTGLAADPANPDCIIATTGLVHMLPHGSVLRICGEKISLAYSKPYTLDPNWRFDPKNISESNYSVPYFSLGGDGRKVWAVGSDGIYHFATDKLPAFSAFPRPHRTPPSRIDWSNPEFILIRTGMNQRHSLSGGSLILVPRSAS
jgi:hypothetical protein